MVLQSRLPAFLLTRPPAQSQRFAGQLRAALGAEVSVTINPLIAPEFPTLDLSAVPFDGLIFTSETGVEAYVRVLPGAQPPDAPPKSAWCVGDRTAQAARAAGLNAVSAKGDAQALMGLIRAKAPRGPLLHLHGEDVRADLAQDLSAAGIPTQALVAYRQAAQPLSDAAIRLLQGKAPVAVPLFSPRTATLFLAGLRDLPTVAPLVIFALSDAVAEALNTQRGGNILLKVATQPTAEALVCVIANTYVAGSRS